MNEQKVTKPVTQEKAPKVTKPVTQEKAPKVTKPVTQEKAPKVTKPVTQEKAPKVTQAEPFKIGDQIVLDEEGQLILTSFKLVYQNKKYQVWEELTLGKDNKPTLNIAISSAETNRDSKEFPSLKAKITEVKKAK